MALRVLVIGATGVFGSRIARFAPDLPASACRARLIVPGTTSGQSASGPFASQRSITRFS